jgi:hypothetical protein
MNAMNKSIPIELYELTAREEEWIPTDECLISEMRNHDLDVVDSIIQYGTPEFYNRELREFVNAPDWKTLVEQQRILVYDELFRIPEGLTPEAKNLAREFRAFVAHRNGDVEFADYGGGKTFRTPAFQEKFENTEAPSTAVMAIVFDGGPVAPLMNVSYEDYKSFDATCKFFEQRGYWFENYLHWWAWVMKS